VERPSDLSKCTAGGLAGGLAVAVLPSLRPPVCIQIGSCFLAPCGHRLLYIGCSLLACVPHVDVLIVMGSVLNSLLP
jgi:hypothetical protein